MSRQDFPWSVDRSRRQFLQASALAAAAVAVPPVRVRAAAPRDQELLSGADARIEQCRKADATIAVVDAAGQPVAGAKIDVQQTRHSFLFGAGLFSAFWGKRPDPDPEPAYRERFAALLNYATLLVKWSPYEPRRGHPAHARMEEVARWCRAHGILAKGHTLAGAEDPAWLPADADEIYRLQMARIDDCVARFRGLIDRWDVVNEATEWDRAMNRRGAPKYSAMWQKYGQTAMPRACFAHARRANPDGVFVINDYITAPAYERVIERLVDPGGKRLYSAVGIQSYMYTSTWPNRQIWQVCERFARFGVPLHFTEVGILSGERVSQKPRNSPWPSTPEGEAYQARETARVYTMLFSHPSVEAISWWDFEDLHARGGCVGFPPSGFLRKDMTPKPVYETLRRLFKESWWTRTRIAAGKDGAARFRGFLGDYRLTVRAGDKTAVATTLTLAKGKPNHWTVKIL